METLAIRDEGWDADGDEVSDERRGRVGGFWLRKLD